MSTHRVDEPVSRLVVDVSAGSLHIVGAEDAMASVTVDGKRADEAEVDVTAGVITVRHPRDGSRWTGGSALRITVQAPEGIDVDVRSASLDVHADIPLGDMQGSTASGDVNLVSASSVRVKSASGDVDIDAVGDFRASMASGDVLAGDVTGDLEVSAASGDVRVQSAAGRIEVRTASGDLRIGRWTGSDLAVKTVSGDVSLTVPAGTRAQLDLKTLSGSVRMPDGPATDVPDHERAPRRMRFTSVSGDFRLQVE